jgi:hypothetical protein
VTAISSELVLAYRSTQYRVQLPESNIVLRVDEYAEPLAKLHAECGVHSSAFITAHNPFSNQVSQEANTAAQQALRNELNARDLKWIEGAGVDPSGQWPPEPSLLVLGIEYQAANDLSVRFKQNGFLFIDYHAVPRLILTGKRLH